MQRPAANATCVLPMEDIDFKCHSPAPQQSVVNGQAVDIVFNYKYLGIAIASKL